MTVRFDQVLPSLLEWLKNHANFLPINAKIVLVRDLRGQIRIISDSKDFKWSGTYDAELSDLIGAYKAPGSFWIEMTNESSMDSFFSAPEAYAANEISDNFRVLDRLVTGREWLYQSHNASAHPDRLVFFGLKGGVGRSTALSMAAWHFAQKGKKVLVIDLDLESPGLANLLLPVRSDLREDGDTSLPGWPDFGMVDWFVEDAVAQANDDLLARMIQPSPLHVSGRGEILVVPAAGGMYAQDYVSKLSRVYADFPGMKGEIEVFGDRLIRAIEQLEASIQPDVVLIDSRAGIHPISATALTRLDANVYMFASDSTQTWAGISALFRHWSIKPELIRQLRQRIRLVSALTPETTDIEELRNTFGEHAYDAFVLLYDSEHAQAPTNDGEAYIFGPFDPDAPHRPIFIWHDRIYGHFEPLRQAVQLNAEKAMRIFGELFAAIEDDARSN